MPLPLVSRRLTGYAAPLFPALAALLVLFWRILARGEVFAARDHSAFYWPVKSVFAALVRSSRGIPLWNPLLASGQPFAANPEHAVFHPLSALLLLLPFEWAFRLQVVLPVLFLALSGYFLGRALLLGRAASAASAVAWGAGGAAVSLVQLLPGLFTLFPLPAALAFAVRIGRRRVTSDVLGFGLIYGLMVLGGDPPALLMGTLLSAAAVLHGNRLDAPANAPGPRVVSPLGRLVLGGLLGALVGAATLLPGLHHGLRTVRAGGLDAATALSYTTPPVRLAELAVPGVFDYGARSDGGGTVGERLYPERGAPFLPTIYPGILVIAAASAAWARRGSPARFWTLPAALGALLALGAATPVFPALRLVPVLSGIRFPERFLLASLAAVAVAGAVGLGRLLEGDPKGLRSAAVGGALALLAAAGLGFAGGVPAPRLAGHVALQAAILAAGLATVVVASRAGRGSLLRLLPALLLAADLVVVGSPLVGSRPPAALRALPAPLLPLLEAPPRGYVFHAARQDTLRGNLGSMASPPFLAQFGIATALERDFDLTELAWSTRATASVLQALASLPGQADAILARRGIAAVVAFRKDAPRTLSEAGARPPSTLLTLLAVPQPQPLAFSADRLVGAGGPEGWRAAIAAAGPGARSLAVVDPTDAPWPVPPGVSVARVAVTARSATRLCLNAEAPGPGPSFVAVNQTWDPGWEALVDGKPLPVVRTDLSLSGLLVPPGRHEIVLVYRSVPVLAGAGLSLLALAATVVAVRSGRPRRDLRRD